MSWTQGVTPSEELPKTIVEYLESQYLQKFGEIGTLQYITWFEPNATEFIADFGTEHSLRVRMKGTG